jgi:hypothetical protein
MTFFSRCSNSPFTPAPPAAGRGQGCAE